MMPQKNPNKNKRANCLIGFHMFRIFSPRNSWIIPDEMETGFFKIPEQGFMKFLGNGEEIGIPEHLT